MAEGAVLQAPQAGAGDLRRIGFVGAAAIAGMVLAAPAEGALECGDTVTGDRKLTQDLVDCPDGGLVVQDNGVTLDMNGHEIRGANDYGIDMLAAKNVTIKNGAIREQPLDGHLRRQTPTGSR